jgi:hypothetical protein
LTSGPFRGAGRTTAILGLVLLLGGCGGGAAQPPVQERTSELRRTGENIAGRSPAEIFEAARVALGSAHSVRLRGNFDNAGTPMRLDLEVVKGGTVQGWIETSGIRYRLIAVDGHSWLRGRDAWKDLLGPEIADLVGDKWVVMPADTGGTTGFEEITNLATFADQVFGPSSATRFDKSSSMTVVNGQPAVRLDAVDGTWWVASTGKPYPLRLDTTSEDGSSQRLELTEYDEPFAISPPDGALDLEEMAG